MRIDINTIDKDNVLHYIKIFRDINGESDEVIRKMFDSSDNSNFDNVFCRVALVDLIYSTGIQRFNKGGISCVAHHIVDNSEHIDRLLLKNEIDYDLFNCISNVDYSNVSYDNGREAFVKSFASKFLNFSKPEVYPIMDSYVKLALGLPEEVTYERFCETFISFKDELEQKCGVFKLKEIDMFLWQWSKIHND